MFDPTAFPSAPRDYIFSHEATFQPTFHGPVGRVSITVTIPNFALRIAVHNAKNWLFIDHPSAEPWLAHVFTIVENGRLLGVDRERYLIDLIGRLADYLAAKIAISAQPPRRVAFLGPRILASFGSCSPKADTLSLKPTHEGEPAASPENG
jgi:hypothetical protein